MTPNKAWPGAVGITAASPGRASFLTYSREELLALRTKGRAGIRHAIPAELRRRPRGCKAGAKLKAELAENLRRYKPSIPSVIMGNVNSLPNKIDELSALNNQRIYRESSLFIFTETWLNHLVPDANVDLLGFTAVRADRDTKASGKKQKVGDSSSVSLRPYYLPREFSHVITVCVYIPPRADAATAYVVSPVKTVRCYPNNKPWVTREVKTVLNKKKAAFRSRDREAMKAAQQEVKHCVKEAKDSYRRKVEQKLRENNMREVWEGVKTITDTTTPPSSSPTSTQSSPLITTDQVRGQLRKLRPRKAAGPDKVCPRLLKTCAAELGEPLQRIFNLSLQIGRVPTLWKTSRIVPVPKKNRPSELNDFRPVALTSHLMKTLERLFLSLLRPQVQHAQDRLQFAYQPGVGVEDAILYLLHRAHSHLDKGSGTVRILFLDFSVQCLQSTPSSPLCFRDKLSRMGVDPQLMDWISDYLTGRPQYVGLKDITSDTVVSSTGAPQGTVLAPLLFTLYTSDFCYNSELCHIQKYADDTAIVGCIRDDREEEYRKLVGDFAAWCHTNHLQLNTSKTKELVIRLWEVQTKTSDQSC
ncbi:hypothetical protein L3Q82_001864 [Scortum barcoo]|uniref:Uncharacterized protein n=1 Tax=Scortum barcoo TaxID=214431 RepID=A0ACB8W484_9TELE|nr:hypothetical protein L3Q82_001864 [Scortum barcoo]